jgi:hypothetical protein
VREQIRRHCQQQPSSAEHRGRLEHRL